MNNVGFVYTVCQINFDSNTSPYIYNAFTLLKELNEIINYRSIQKEMVKNKITDSLKLDSLQSALT